MSLKVGTVGVWSLCGWVGLGKQAGSMVWGGDLK
jgi:hypothetical protein